jgi:hypothetical protein
MKFVCLVYHDEPKLLALSPAELETLVADCIVWIAELEKEGRHVMSAGLQSDRTAVSLRLSPGKVAMTDGPFAETKEFLGGFTLFEARDRAEALAIAARMPALRIATVEVRPVLDPDGEITDGLDHKLAAAMRIKSRGVDAGLASRVAFVSKTNLGRDA